MARLFLHIGAHKTATSFLQGTFFRNRDRLARHGVIYPAPGPNQAHHVFALPWMEVAGVPENFLGTKGPDGLWERFVDRHAHGSETVLLSAENFSRAYPDPVDMADLARRTAAFDEVTIVYTTRQQVDLLPSHWSQIAKDRKPPTLRAYVARAIKDHLAGGIWIDHNAVYDHVLTGFAPDQIRVLDYDHVRTEPGGVLGAFLRLLDCDLEAETLTPLPRAQANISADPLATFLASRICDGNIPPEKMVTQIAAVLQAFGSTSHPSGSGRVPTTLLTRREHARLRAIFHPLNDKLVQRVRVFQPDFAFFQDAPPENMIYRDDVETEIWARIAAALQTSPTTPFGMHGIRDTVARVRFKIDAIRFGNHDA